MVHAVDRLAELKVEIAERMTEYRALRRLVLDHKVGCQGVRFEATEQRHLVIRPRRPVADTERVSAVSADPGVIA